MNALAKSECMMFVFAGFVVGFEIAFSRVGEAEGKGLQEAKFGLGEVAK